MADADRPVVSPDEVRRVAGLARVAVDVGEVGRVAGELADILAHVRELDHRSSSLDHRSAGVAHRASGVDDPASGPADPGSPPPRTAFLRGDEPDREAMERDPEAFAPVFRDGFFLVPRLASHDGGDGS